MKNTPHFLTRILFFALLTGLVACSPLHETGSLQNPPPANYDETTPESREKTQENVVEPEEDLVEELYALNQIKIWEKGQQVEPASEREEDSYDFPITVNKQVEFYLDLFQNRQRTYFKRWLARSTMYRPLIEQELEKAGLPKDLLYLAMIESGYNPSAYSHAHAAGLWQFIKGTGRNYGLRIDSWVDERREPEKATRAAAAYLASLYERFDDWYLAVAAYNAGEGKIERAIKKYNSRDFWELAQHKYLRLETKRYVPKLIAAIIIAKDPEKYGFSDIEYQEPTRYDLIEVPDQTDLAAVAVTAHTDVKTLRKLNNELRKDVTPADRTTYQLKIPDGTRALVAANLSRLHPVITTGYKTHTVRSGDSLTLICRTYQLNKTTLLKANNLRSAKLREGQRLRIPYRTTKYVLLKDGETAKSRFAQAGGDGQMYLHEIKRGETLSRISKQYNVPVDIIMQWNNISNARKIRAGQQLALYISSPTDTTGYATTATADVSTSSETIILADTKKQPPSAPSEAVPTITWYNVRNGDSLWTISRKFKVSARDIRRWNNLASNLIHPGKRLVVKKG